MRLSTSVSAVAACLLAVSSAIGAGPQLRQSGRWMVDDLGRVVLSTA